MNLVDILSKLKDNRPVFHSEDDFKLALAQTIYKEHPEYNIRLERPIKIEMIDKYGSAIKPNVRVPIDIVIIDEKGNYIPIELKYKTKKTKIESTGVLNDDIYELANHGASDIGRVSFRKDIYRIERFLESNSENCKVGFVIILTNEKEYWDNILEKEILNKHYSFHNNMNIPKDDPGWYYKALNDSKYIETDGVWHSINDPKKKHWTYIGDLKYQLNLKKEYEINWRIYSKIGQSLFKFCLLEVE